MKEVSKRRFVELRRLRRDAERLHALVLAADTDEPHIFDERHRQDLLNVFHTVVKSQFVFTRIKKLRSNRRREYWTDWHCGTIFGSLESYASVKLVGESILGIKIEHRESLPRNVNALMRAHGELYHGLWASDRADNDRVKVLLQLIQLELVWFGHMW